MSLVYNLSLELYEDKFLFECTKNSKKGCENDVKRVLDEAILQRVNSYLNLCDVEASKFFKGLIF